MRRAGCLAALGCGGLALGGILALLLLAVIPAVLGVFLSGVGPAAARLESPATGGAPPPAFATPASRPAEWLGLVTQEATLRGLPAEVVLAVVAAASGGNALADTAYCSNGATAPASCDQAFPPGAFGLGPQGVTTVGVARGLMGLTDPPAVLPHPHDPQANVAQGTADLVRWLGGAAYWQAALNGFHAAFQQPPGWPADPGYADQLRQWIATYEAGPQLGAWALAAWDSQTGQWTDPGDRPEWVLVVATGPYGPAWSHAWKPPTWVCSPQGGPCQWVDHRVSGHAPEPPVAVTGRTADGHAVAFAWSPRDPAVPTVPGASLWGAQVPLQGPHRLVQITATWNTPQGVVSASLPWPPAGAGSVGQVAAIPPGQALAPYWPDILAASRATGVPAAWLAAEMLAESGGQNVCYRGDPTQACGVMQIEPGTAIQLGFTPQDRLDPAKALLMGAEYLAQQYATFGSWELASAAYYGGPASVKQALRAAGLSWPTAWTPAVQQALAIVPFPQAGNSETMTQYADTIAATAARLVVPAGGGS